MTEQHNPRPLIKLKECDCVDNSYFYDDVRDALLLLKKEQARILFDIQPKIRTGDIIDILVAIDEAFPAFAEDTTIDKSHDANCEGSMCYCKSRRQKKGAE